MVAQKTHDKKIKILLEFVGQLLTGEQSPAHFGRTQELDALAGKFVALSDDDRASAIDTAEKLKASAPPDTSDEYVEAMRAVVKKGSGTAGKAHVTARMEELVGKLKDMQQEVTKKDGKDGPSKEAMQALRANSEYKALMGRLNVLSEFLSAEDHVGMQKRMEKREKAKAKKAKTAASHDEM